MPKIPAAPAAPPADDPSADDGIPIAQALDVIDVPAAIKKAAGKQAPAAAKAAPKKGVGGTQAPAPWAGLVDQGEYVNALYAGDSGTGKTSHLAAMARQGRVLFCNAESGIKVRPLRKMGVPVENIVVWPNAEAGETLTFDGLEGLYWQIKADLEADPNSWAGVVWDSLSEIHKRLLESVVKTGAEKAARMGKDRDRFFVDVSDYGTMSEQVRFLLRRFRDLPCHFGLSSLLRRDTDDDGKVIYRPAVTPALANDVVGFMDLVCYTSVGEIGGQPEYRGTFTPQGKYRGKDRFGVMPPVLVNPTFDRLVAYATEDLVHEEDPVQIAAREAREAEAQAKAAKA